jgi:hypothetical protein
MQDPGSLGDPDLLSQVFEFLKHFQEIDQVVCQNRLLLF